MDLEARTREFFAAMDDVQVDRILALVSDDARYEVRGVLEPLDKPAYGRYLKAVRRTMPRVRFTLEDVAVKRNVAFAQWRNEGLLASGERFENRGVHVLSWGPDGRVVHATVYTEPEKVRALLSGGG